MLSDTEDTRDTEDREPEFSGSVPFPAQNRLGTLGGGPRGWHRLLGQQARRAREKRL